MPDIDLAQITPVTDSAVARLASSAAYAELASHIMATSVAAGSAQAPVRGRRRRVSRWLPPVAAMAAVAALAGVTVAVRQIGRGPASVSQSAAGRPDIY